MDSHSTIPPDAVVRLYDAGQAPFDAATDGVDDRVADRVADLVAEGVADGDADRVADGVLVLVGVCVVVAEPLKLEFCADRVPRIVRL